MVSEKLRKCKSKHHIGDRMVTEDEMCRDKSKKDGFHDMCKACSRENKRQWQKRVYENNDPTIQSLEEFRKANVRFAQNRRKRKGIAWAIFNSAKNRARNYSIEFNLLESDIVIPKKCPIFNTPLIQEVTLTVGNVFAQQHNYPSIDRIDPSKGYTKDNIQIISWRANNLKSNATLDELIALGKFAKKLKNKT